MKTDTIVVLAAAALGVFAVFKLTRQQASAGPAYTLNRGGNVPLTNSGEIANTALPGQPGWGWKYYADGTSIGPDGTYYMGDVKVWSPAG